MPASDYALPDWKRLLRLSGCSGVFRLFFPGAGGMYVDGEPTLFFVLLLFRPLFELFQPEKASIYQYGG